MERGGGGRRGTLAALVVAVGIAALGTLAPAGAIATDSDLKHAYAFRVEASNGYSILAFAASQRADGQGEVALIVHRRNASVIYGAPAMLTATSIEADLGALGSISLDVSASGRKRKLRSGCGEGPETVTVEPQIYRGVFEFHGEEGYTDAISSAPPEYTRFFVDLLCAGVGQGEVSGPALPGARLRLHSHVGSFRLNLQANKNRPGARARFEVETHEERQGVEISRSATFWAGAGAFEFDPSLRTATLAPPAPFSGGASFHRNALAANRWSGNLTVDLPGRSNVPLGGTGVAATLIPACWHKGEGRFRC